MPGSLKGRGACILAISQDGGMDAESVKRLASAFVEGDVDVWAELASMEAEGLSTQEGGSWDLTPLGEAEASRLARENAIVRSTWVGRVDAVNALVDLALMALMLSIGWVTGSVALIVLGANSGLAAMSDAMSSLHRPRASLVAMTAATIAVSLVLMGCIVLRLTQGGFADVSDRPTVIAVAAGALIASLAMRGLNRFTAERTGSIVALSRARYSTARATMALGLILFTFLSMNDTPMLDPALGIIVAAISLFDGLNLWAEYRRVRDGRVIDITAFRSRLDTRYGSENLVPYRSWALHVLGNGWMNKVTLIRSLMTAFPHSRTPVLVGEEGPGIDMAEGFEGIVGPMLKTRLIVRTDDDRISTTPVGRMYVRHSLRSRRHSG